ncbi:MAG: hypothetical protein WCB53_15045 [Terriglobales bacterium]
MNLGPHFVVLNKIAAIGSRQSQIDSLNKTAVVLKVTAQDLLRQFVGLQPSCAAICASCSSFAG